MVKSTLREARKAAKQMSSLKPAGPGKPNKKSKQHEVTQGRFDKEFLKLLRQCTKPVFLDEHGCPSSVPTSFMDLCNSKGEWLFNVQLAGERHFWVNYDTAWPVLRRLADGKAVQGLMRHQMQILFKLGGITPYYAAGTTAETVSLLSKLEAVTQKIVKGIQEKHL